MKLKDYLWRSGLSIRKFAEETLYSKSYVSAVISGKRQPSRRFIRDVLVHTKGLVNEDGLVCVPELGTQ